MVHVTQVAISVVNTRINFCCNSLRVRIAVVLQLLRSYVQAVRCLQISRLKRRKYTDGALINKIQLKTNLLYNF